jgi:hypothetical protein
MYAGCYSAVNNNRPVAFGRSRYVIHSGPSPPRGSRLAGPVNRNPGRDEHRLNVVVPYPLEVQMSTTAAQTGTKSPNKLLGMTFGIVYLLVGLAGFAVTGGVGFAATDGNPLILFEVNPLHNIVHLLVGALLLGGALRGPRVAKGVNTLVGGVYLLVGLLGLFLVGSSANILALNGADNVLHFASAILLLGVGLSQDKAAARVA